MACNGDKLKGQTDERGVDLKEHKPVAAAGKVDKTGSHYLLGARELGDTNYDLGSGVPFCEGLFRDDVTIMIENLLTESEPGSTHTIVQGVEDEMQKPKIQEDGLRKPVAAVGKVDQLGAHHLLDARGLGDTNYHRGSGRPICEGWHGDEVPSLTEDMLTQPEPGNAYVFLRNVEDEQHEPNILEDGLHKPVTAGSNTDETDFHFLLESHELANKSTVETSYLL